MQSADRRVNKGDPMFIMLPPVPQWYVAALGMIRIGATPVPGTNAGSV